MIPRSNLEPVSLLPNLGQTGNVLNVAGTGGSALSACADFLADEESVARLRRFLPAAKGGVFPTFEALVRVRGRITLPKDASVVLCRIPRN
jgi:hypothetical protein